MRIPEHSLLILLLNKEAYRQYNDLIDLEYLKETFRELSYIYRTLVELHEQHPDKDISLSEVQTYFFVKYPDSNKQVYEGLFKTLQELRLDPGVGEGILSAFKRKQRALELSEAAFKVAQGVVAPDILTGLLEEWDKGVDHSTVEFTPVDTDLEYIVNKSYKPGGLYWRLDFLNKSLGPLRDGDFGFVFKRPETGGTAFCASEASFFLDQTDRPIVWINNEGENEKVILRVYQSYFGVPIDVLIYNLNKYNQEFKEKTKGKLLFFGLDKSNKKAIEAIVDKYNPAVVLYDQLSKVKGFTNDREDLRLGSIFQWARDLANNRHAAIGIHQADGTAEGVRYLTMEHCANAKTAIQAEADFIVGIGATHDPTEENIRFLSISKNKLLGDPNVRENLRHGRAEVILNTKLMRFEDIVKY